MKAEFSTLELTKNTANSRFELLVEDQQPFIEYKERNKKVYLIHTEVPKELEGKGVGAALIEKTLTYLDQNGYKLVALCPAVVAFIRRHPEWKRLLDLEQTDIV
ncbi:GNAT family N-acetyltransferase [Olivibacter sp. XZL3]|uniref:GNAT family N-acetyltransferase n=1 Tax=Olivibacter sp. XZL3 TaxID=1735116 RepID=UPI001066D3A4|nr:GNAT family N-acetyltransferase [Olivibacter sp. XZL3]